MTAALAAALLRRAYERPSERSWCYLAPARPEDERGDEPDDSHVVPIMAEAWMAYEAATRTCVSLFVAAPLKQRQAEPPLSLESDLQSRAGG